jgi:putative flippase GtrA
LQPRCRENGGGAVFVNKAMIKFFKKHWEVLSYLIFGVLTTLLNILLYALFSRLFGYTAANSWGNVLDNALCILFAYCTNRAFVFRSKTTGKAMAKEFGTFVTCRLGTMVLDAVIMIVGGNLLAAQGAALMESLFGSFLTVSGSYTGAAASAAASVAGVAIIGGADGPTAVFVTTRITAQEIWGLCVKVFSNVVVVVLNYVFSKLIIFKKK